MPISGSKAYSIESLARVREEDIPALPKVIRASIQRAIEERLMVDPIGFGKPLQYSFKGHRRLRVGDYRVIYRIEESKRIVLIVSIKHRKHAYEN